MNNQKLPPIDPETFDGEKQTCIPHPVSICSDHTRTNWMKHVGYRLQNGTIECTLCPWGTKVPGYFKVIDEKIIDLRSEKMPI
jgi:hypothetical protein